MGNVDIIYHSRVSDTERKVESGRSFRSCVLLSPGQREGRGAGEACREIGGGSSLLSFLQCGELRSQKGIRKIVSQYSISSLILL